MQVLSSSFIFAPFFVFLAFSYYFFLLLLLYLHLFFAQFKHNFRPWFVCGKLRAWKPERSSAPSTEIERLCEKHNGNKNTRSEDRKKATENFSLLLTNDSYSRVWNVSINTLVKPIGGGGGGWPYQHVRHNAPHRILCDCYILNRPSTFKRIFSSVYFSIVRLLYCYSKSIGIFWHTSKCHHSLTKISF